MVRQALRDARERKRLTQAQLAERVGLKTRDHYGHVERGEVALPDALTDKLASELDVDPWVINPEYGGITDEEREVLQRLRKIDRDKRRMILETVLDMLDAFWSRSRAA